MVTQFLKQVLCSAAFLVVCSAALLVVPSVLEAQQVPTGLPFPAAPEVTAPPSNTGAPPNTDADLRARLERLERQNQELMRSIQAMQAGNAAKGTAKPAGTTPLDEHTVKSFVDNYLMEMEATKTQEEDAKEAKQAQEGHRIGSENLKITPHFEKTGLFLWFATPDEDFTMHPGIWAQWDNVWFGQSNYLNAPADGRPGHAQGVASGVNRGGIGPLQDGTFFRRIRPYIEGTFWDIFEYRLILAAENDQFSSEGLDEFWIGVNKIPFIGTIRMGHCKTPMGLEGDMTASSRDMTFMERSSYSEAIELNQNFSTGIWFNNTYFDDRMSQQFMIFRPDQGASSGAFFGTGQWGWQGRLTGLPLYEEEGRKLLHLGISYGYRNGQDTLATSPFRLMQLRARPELRDDVPAASASNSQSVPNSNSNRLIDTGTIAAASQYLLGLELLQIWGPFSVQAEYGWNFVNGAVGANPTGQTFNPAIKPGQNYMFNGGYVQLAYTLTGENRGYDKKIGTLARYYYGAGGPYTNAWFVRDENGRLNVGTGAWEIAARYSYVNLNDGTGLNRIAGGRLDGLSLALNWYLNRNMNLMIDWVSDRRSDVPPGAFAGYINGFGTELQIQF